MEKKSNKLDPDTYLAQLNSKKIGMLQSTTSDFDRKAGTTDGHLRELSPWTDKKAKNPTAVEIMIKKKRDVQNQKFINFTRNLGVHHGAGMHPDMATTTYAGQPFIGSPFTADDENTAPLISMQPVSRNAIMNQR